MPRQDRGIPLKSKTKSAQRPETVAMIYKRKWPAAVFLLPAFVFMVIFLFYPFIRNIIDSFFNVSQLGAPHGAFIGAENYLKIIPGLETTDPNMVIAVKNTLLLMACTIVFQVGIALVLALMVDTIQKGSQVFRTLFFSPSWCPPPPWACCST